LNCEFSILLSKEIKKEAKRKKGDKTILSAS